MSLQALSHASERLGATSTLDGAGNSFFSYIWRLDWFSVSGGRGYGMRFAPTIVWRMAKASSGARSGRRIGGFYFKQRYRRFTDL